MPEDHLVLWDPPATVHPSQLHIPHPPGYTYRDPIPTFTTQTPGELLDNYYVDRRNPCDRTDSNGVLSERSSVRSSGKVGEWPRPHGLAAEPVPVRWDLVRPAVLDIEFRNLNRECPSAGVPMLDFHLSNASALAGAGDIVCREFRVSMWFIIVWPGYRPRRYTIRTTSDDGGHLRRFELGQEITRAYAHYFMRVEEDQTLPNDAGIYNISLHQGSRAKPDSLGVQLLQLHLVRVRGITGGTWIAEVDIV